MSQPLVELRRLILEKQAVSGRVIAVANGLLRVATAGGVVEIVSITGIIVGDIVTIHDGRLTKGRVDLNTPVYYV